MIHSSLFRNQLLTLFVLFFSIKSYSQNDTLEARFLNNDSATFRVILKTKSVTDTSTNWTSRFLVWIRMPKEVQKYFNSKDSVYWMNHLRDPASDWATNLVLYYLCKREAGALKGLYTNRDSWLPYKKQEIESWRKWLGSKNIISH